MFIICNIETGKFFWHGYWVQLPSQAAWYSIGVARALVKHGKGKFVMTAVEDMDK